MDVFTTGEAARVCGVAPRTVVKWFDEGRFDKGYRLPGSSDRRIPRASLEKFMTEHSFPMDKLPAPAEAKS